MHLGGALARCLGPLVYPLGGLLGPSLLGAGDVGGPAKIPAAKLRICLN